MSFNAVTWASQQKGLKPREFRVLLRIASYHSDYHGAFPSQVRLAKDCEMSRRSVNYALSGLAAKGMIVRERRRCQETMKMLSTRYTLGRDKNEYKNVIDMLGPYKPLKEDWEMESEKKQEETSKTYRVTETDDKESNQMWLDVLDTLLGHLPHAKVFGWLGESYIGDLSGTTAIIIVKTAERKDAFVAHWIKQHMSDHLLKAFNQHGITAIEIYACKDKFHCFKPISMAPVDRVLKAYS